MFDGLESAPIAILPPMAKSKSKSALPKKSGADAGQAERLKRLREMLGYSTAIGFARFLHMVPQRWSNFENGMPLSREIAFRLVRTVPGLTLDWLYFGKPDGLPLDLARRLGEIEPPPGKRTT
jgi:hypothetical protein